MSAVRWRCNIYCSGLVTGPVGALRPLLSRAPPQVRSPEVSLNQFRFSRRDVLIGGVGIAAVASTSSRVFAESPQVIVDVHCHTFNGQDLPVAGFVRCFLLGQGWPSLLVDLVKDDISDLEARVWQGSTTAADELAIVDRLLSSAAPVPTPLVSPALPTPTEAAVFASAAKRARLLAAAEDDKAHPGLNTFLMSPDVDDGTALAAFLQFKSARDPVLAQRLKSAGAPKLDLKRIPKLGPGFKKEIFLAPEANKGWLGSLLSWMTGGLVNVVAFLSHFTKRRLDLTQQLAGTIGPEIALFVPALVDFNLWASGESAPAPMSKQVEIQGKLSRLHALGRVLPGGRKASFHGYVAFNPWVETFDPRYAALRGDADTEFKVWDADAPKLSGTPFDVVRAAVVDHGFIGVKLYPPAGFKPLDNEALPKDHFLPRDTRRLVDLALRRLYRWCEEQSVPLLVHTGSSNLFDTDFEEYARPDNWRPVFKLYPSLRILLGHFGGTSESKVEGKKRRWIDLGAELALEREVYFDISNAESPLDSKRVTPLVAALLKAGGKDLRTRMMYGTDFFMNDLVKDPARYRASVAQQLTTDAELKKLGDGFPRSFFGDNALRFYGFRDDKGAPADATLLGNRGRLLAWYKINALSLPLWLS